MKGKVSVLMPVFNTRYDWLWTAIAGIAGQSYPNLHLILSDDGSTASSTLLALQNAQETWPDRVRVVRSPENKGTAYALDRALGEADADTVYFSKADSDDMFHRDREKNRVDIFESLPPQVGIVYDNYLQLNYEPRPHIVPVTLRPYDYRQLTEQSYIPGPSMWRASVYEKIPKTFVYDGYDGKCNKHGEDYANWLSITDYFDGFWYNCDPAFTWTYRFYPKSKYNSDRKGVDYARSHIQHKAKERRGLL